MPSRTHTRTSLSAALVTLCVVGAAASDWPNYQGPKRDGTSTQQGVSRAWPKDGPKTLWTVPLGAGFGGPAVKDGKVYLLDRDEAVGDTLRVYDIVTGKELWTFAYDAPGRFMFADGLLPSVDGNTKLYLIEPDPSGFKPLASAELLESGNNWAPIALVDGKLLIRDQKQMKCLQVAQ